jgi:S1-C subfamily serine protease
MTSNVFLAVRDGDDRWSGSGIVVAREGSRVAVLTNRHVVEDDRTQRLGVIRALTVGGELVPATVLWRAGRGVDLALCEIDLERPDVVSVTALGAAGVQVGDGVFAIGNPLGLAWSYTRGTLSAARQFTTPAGHAVRILQTDAAIAPGSSGGGLFRDDGTLVGVMSFVRQGHIGGSAHFALSMAAIAEALSREGVRWVGRALVA